MEQENIESNFGNRKPRILSGLFLVAIGILLLAYKMGAPIPAWIFTWPVLLIVIGFFIGVKSRFRNPGAFILLLIGTIFFIDQQVPMIQFHNYILPLILIGLGILFMLRPRHTPCGGRHRRWERMSMRHQVGDDFSKGHSSEANPDNAEYIDVNAVFGGIKKKYSIKKF